MVLKSAAKNSYRTINVHIVYIYIDSDEVKSCCQIVVGNVIHKQSMSKRKLVTHLPHSLCLPKSQTVNHPPCRSPGWVFYLLHSSDVHSCYLTRRRDRKAARRLKRTRAPRFLSHESEDGSAVRAGGVIDCIHTGEKEKRSPSFVAADALTVCLCVCDVM